MIARRTLLAAPALLVASRAFAADPVLRVGDQKGGVQALLKAANLLDGLPYRVAWSQFAAAAPLLEALNANAVDTAFAGDAPSTFALAQGVQARIIGATRGTGRSTSIVVPEASSIRDVAQLKGRRIGTNRGSIGHALVLAVAKRQGWAFADLPVANLLPADAKAALTGGAVEGWSTWNTFVAQAVVQDHARVVVDGRDGLLSGLSFQLARPEAISEKRALLHDFLGRYARAKLWALDHEQDYARALAAEIGVSEEVALWSFRSEGSRPVPIDASVIAGEQGTADLYAEARLIPQKLDAASAFDRSFNAAVAGA